MRFYFTFASLSSWLTVKYPGHLQKRECFFLVSPTAENPFSRFFISYQTSSASTSHSAPNWQMSQVDVSFCPFSAEPSFPAWIHKDETRQHKLSKVLQILLQARWAGNHQRPLSLTHTHIHKWIERRRSDIILILSLSQALALMRSSNPSLIFPQPRPSFHHDDFWFAAPAPRR